MTYDRFVIQLYSIVFIAVGTISCTFESQRKTLNAAEVRFKSCHLSATGLATRIKAKCALVEVPESWGTPTSRKISLHVAVVPAEGSNSNKEPLFFFAGGPGQAATESYVALVSGFDKINRNRNVVLIDQRGTGKSNPLQCLPPQDTNPYDDLPESDEEQWIHSCAASLKANLAEYTTTASLKDFDYIRSLLGYDKINLYGVSYGSRVALSYMRQYPNNVRSVILDGVVPPTSILGPEILSEGPKRTKENVIRKCQADANCLKHFPKLSAEFQSLEEAILTNPPKVSMLHPRTGKKITAKLSWQNWALTLRIMGYANKTEALLPLLIHYAHQNKDFSPLLAQSINVIDTLRDAINNGLQNSVLCSEDWPFFTNSAENFETDKYNYGAREIASLAKLCKIWPHQVVPASFKAPVRSPIPTLILSGEIDPVTPPANGKLVAKYLSQSRHLIVPGQGHGVITQGCIPKLVAEFVATANVSGIDISCVSDIKPWGFFVDFAGPES